MKREISFRGKSKRTGEWVFGNLFDKDTKGRTHIGTTVRMCFDIDPETVGQYTGIDDMEGEKLFEGDIYNMGDDNIRYVVVWRKCMFIGKQIGSNSYAGLDYFESEIKKVGNIYDNKELLK
ncbi:MAG: YopX family protein [Lachnospiraceae bacterium]|nr:YopX family protein [Lachnospiraceae bacterium]